VTELDQISAAIGRLQEAQESAERQRARIFEQLARIAEQTSEIPGLANRIEAMEPHVEDYRRLKQRGIGVLGVIAVGGSLLGAWFRELWDRFWP
jgi:chromosome segregation ATPase